MQKLSFEFLRVRISVSHLKTFKVLLEISLGRLRSRPNGHRQILEVITGRTRLEQVGACLVVCSDQHADAVRSPHVRLRGPLVHICQI